MNYEVEIVSMTKTTKRIYPSLSKAEKAFLNAKYYNKNARVFLRDLKTNTIIREWR